MFKGKAKGERCLDTRSYLGFYGFGWAIVQKTHREKEMLRCELIRRDHSFH